MRKLRRTNSLSPKSKTGASGWSGWMAIGLDLCAATHARTPLQGRVEHFRSGRPGAGQMEAA
jgi:hypothetical protein